MALLPGCCGQGNLQPAKRCALSRRFDYVLDQQAYVAIDNDEPLNEDIINDFLKDPVHKVCVPSAVWGRDHSGGLPPQPIAGIMSCFGTFRLAAKVSARAPC